MNGRRLLRLLCVAVINFTLSVLALRLALRSRSELSISLLATIVCLGSAIGIVLEALRNRWARIFNIGVPAIVTATMLASSVWFPFVAHMRNDPYVGEASEGAAFVLILAGVPFCLTLCVALVYWLIDIDPDPTVTLELR